MYRHILLYGAMLLLLCACGENRPEKSKQKEIAQAPQIDTENRASNSDGTLSLPGDLTSVFDLAIYQHINVSDPELAIKQDFLRGGLLYDTWWTFANGSVGEAPPVTSTSHPSWPTSINNTLSPVATWQCVTCHGWDYMGAGGVFSDPVNPNFSGIRGLIQGEPATPLLIYDFIHNGQTMAGFSHEFGGIIEDNDIYALTRFVSTIQNQAADLSSNLSPFSIIDLASKKVIADAAKGYVQYHTPLEEGGCDENCHGIDGQLINLDSNQGVDLSTMTNNDPWQVLHKIRFGQPGSVPFMPGLSPFNDEALNFQLAANTLSYTQVGLIRDYIRGGRLYDNFFKETAQLAPAQYNHLWDQRDVSFDSPLAVEDSWTCSGCHGYDYFGQIGFDNNLLYLRERPWTEDYLFTRLTEGFTVRVWPDPLVLIAHDYKNLLNDNDRWDLVAFMMNGVIDTYRYLYTTWSSVGDFNVGRELYQIPYSTLGSCVKCHGMDGTGDGIVENPTVDIFAYSWDAPWEFLHKVRFGVAGKDMPAMEGSNILQEGVLAVDVAADIQQYSQQRIDTSITP